MSYFKTGKNQKQIQFEEVKQDSFVKEKKRKKGFPINAYVSQAIYLKEKAGKWKHPITYTKHVQSLWKGSQIMALHERKEPLEK